MRHRLALSLAAVALLATLALGSCDHGSSPTAAHPELDPGVEAPEPASGSPFLLSAGKPVLPPGLRNLPVAQVMTMELVGFPHPDDVGVCFTQVASPSWIVRARLAKRGIQPDRFRMGQVFRQDPFRLHRLEVDLPQQAWAEADGGVAFLQYRRFDEDGHVHRLARCVIPAARMAVDHLFARFSVRPLGTGSGLSPSRASPSQEGWVPLGAVEASSRASGLSPSIFTGDLSEGNCVVDPGTHNPCELDELAVEVCQNFLHEKNDDTGECVCWNGAPNLETCQWDEGGGGEDEGGGGEEEGGGGEGGEGDDVGVGWGDPPPPDCAFEPCDPCDPSQQDCPLFGISIALADDAVLPGGITSVTVTVHPPYPGVTVYLSSSVSGLDPSCNVPIGVFGDPEGETGSEGTFTTTYKAGLDVEVETIYADVSDALDNLFTDEASLGVTGTCQDQRDRIVWEYGHLSRPNGPSCGQIKESGGSTHFTWAELNGHWSTGNPHQPWGYIEQNLLNGLELTRAAWGEGINVLSGYRTPCGNDNQPGSSTTSWHQYGRAADIYPNSPNTPERRLTLLQRALENDAHHNSYHNETGNTVHVQWQ